MSKLAIVLLAVLFTSATKVTSRSNELETVQRHVQNIINGTFSKVQENSKIIHEMSQEVTDRLMNETSEFNLNMMNEIMHVGMKTTGDINGLEPLADVNITECTQFTRRAIHDGYSVIGRIRGCTNVQQDMRLKQISIIDKIFVDAFVNLTEIKEKTQHCGDNTVDPGSFYVAMSCIQLAAINATSISDDIIELTPTLINGLIFILETHKPSLENCKSTNGYENFHRGMSIAIQNTAICIHRMNTKADDDDLAQ